MADMCDIQTVLSWDRQSIVVLCLMLLSVQLSHISTVMLLHSFHHCRHSWTSACASILVKRQTGRFDDARFRVLSDRTLFYHCIRDI